MMSHELSELWTALMSPPTELDLLQKKLNLPRAEYDIYLAYTATPEAQFAGYLVCGLKGIDDLTAFCPVPQDLRVASASWFRAVSQQLDLAIRVMRDAGHTRRPVDVIWLDKLVAQSQPVPTWIYSLACAPITYPWDGRYVHPRPFCPKLFESLARQPEAETWMRKQRAVLQ